MAPGLSQRFVRYARTSPYENLPRVESSLHRGSLRSQCRDTIPPQNMDGHLQENLRLNRENRGRAWLAGAPFFDCDAFGRQNEAVYAFGSSVVGTWVNRLTSSSRDLGLVYNPQ